jgi:hypothetical protein
MENANLSWRALPKTPNASYDMQASDLQLGVEERHADERGAASAVGLLHDCPRRTPPVWAVRLGLGRIVALCYGSPTLYQTH